MPPPIAVAAGCGILTQDGPGGKSKLAQLSRVDFLPGENSGENSTALKEGIIGNDVVVSWLFPAPAEFRGFYCLDRGVGDVSGGFVAVAAGCDGADEDESVDAAADGFADGGSARAGAVSEVFDECASGCVVLSALWVVAQWSAAAASAGRVCGAAAEWIVIADLDFAGRDWVWGVCVLAVG